MKTIFTTALMLVIFSLSFAQTEVNFKINHKLGLNDFEMGMESANNLDNTFKVERLEYYISKITLVHDGGKETTIDDFWILVNADQDTEVSLGGFYLQNLEGVKFHIGVEEELNHEDPSAYNSDHPLAPKAPSMHWGWSAGYRFIAIEGKSGAGLNQIFQLHGLGDENYFEVALDLNLTSEGDQPINIEIDADYNKVLQDISLVQGVITHGSFGDAKKSLENCRDYVFTPSASVLSSEETSLKDLVITPNPSLGNFTINYADMNKNHSVEVYNLIGKKVQTLTNIDNVFKGKLKDSGLYIINIIENGKIIGQKKLIVQ